MKPFITTLFLLLALTNIVPAQNDTIAFTRPELTFDAFIDIFYSYDFNRPPGSSRTDFFFNHNRHNEFNLNLGLARVTADGGRYRAALGLMAGTYPADNLAAEPPLLKNVFEANVGLRLSTRHPLWLDVGIMPSHIGFESAISTDNLTLTRSIMAENSPYYLTGAKVSYALNDQWQFALLIVNGWQLIQRIEGNSLPGFGTQVTYTAPGEQVTLNWSTYVGSEFPDEQRRMRIFNDFYALFRVNDKLEVITGFDIGVEQKAKGSSDYSSWMAPAVLTHYQFNRHWGLGARIEYFSDPDEVIITTGTANGFRTFGFSANLDYQPFEAISCRIEGRFLSSEDAIFQGSGGQEYNLNTAITTSLAIRL